MVGVLYHLMVDVMGPLARWMSQLPVSNGLYAGPDPSTTITGLAAEAIAADPGVGPIAAPLREEAALAILT